METSHTPTAPKYSDGMTRSVSKGAINHHDRGEEAMRRLRIFFLAVLTGLSLFGYVTPA